jgi:hypothetical protein
LNRWQHGQCANLGRALSPVAQRNACECDKRGTLTRVVAACWGAQMSSPEFLQQYKAKGIGTDKSAEMVDAGELLPHSARARSLARRVC